MFFFVGFRRDWTAGDKRDFIGHVCESHLVQALLFEERENGGENNCQFPRVGVK